jgi:hypothetical protein
MSFSIVAPKVVAGESYYSGSIIARQAFTVTVRALNSDGSTDTSYSGIATLYANSATNDRAYNIGTATALGHLPLLRLHPLLELSQAERLLLLIV